MTIGWIFVSVFISVLLKLYVKPSNRRVLVMTIPDEPLTFHLGQTSVAPVPSVITNFGNIDIKIGRL